MRRAWSCLAAMVISANIAALARAETDAADKKAQSQFGGKINLDGFYRDQFFDRIWFRSGSTAGPQSEGFLNGDFALSADIMPSNTVTMRLELRTQPDVFGFEYHRIGDNFNIPQFTEAWIQVKNVFGKWTEGRDFALMAGLQNFRFDTRNIGRDVFFMDPSNSENPFTGLPGLPAHAGGVGAGLSVNTPYGGNPWLNSLSGIAKRSETGGFRATLTPHRDAHLDLGAFIMMEGGATDVELGTQVYFFNFDFEFDLSKKASGLKKGISYEDQSLFSILITGIQGKRTFIGDGGLGVDLLFTFEGAQFELYGEAHYQNGEYSKTESQDVLNPTIMHEDMVPHEAFGAMVGMRLKMNDRSGMHPYIDVSGWYLSGDEGDIHGKSRDFISFESVNSMLIIESDMGLDIDTNYFAVKGEIGTHLPGSAKPVSIEIRGGFFQLVEAYHLAVDTGEKNLGFEVDGFLRWDVSESAQLYIGGAFLGGATFFETQYLTDASTMMGAVGINAKF